MNPDELIHHYLDGTATQAEADELSRQIESDTATRDRYLALAELHTALSADETLREVKAASVLKRNHHTPWLKIAAAVALLASGVWWIVASAQVAPPMAKLISSMNAQWTDENTELSLNAGEAPTGILRLLEGKVEFATSLGAMVTLEGATAMRFENATTIFIESGKVVCRCPTPESRVTVRTPQTQVIDLGTEFVVEARADLSTRVAVLSGEVRVGEDASSRVLHEGEGAEVRSQGLTMLHTEVVREMQPRVSADNAASNRELNRLTNPSFDGDSGWQLASGHSDIADGVLRVSSHGNRFWPSARQTLWESGLSGKIITASARAMQLPSDPFQPMQFAVLKIVFNGERGRSIAYASRHFQFGGEPVGVFHEANIKAEAPPGTKGVTLELLLNARGEERGTVVFDDAVLSITPTPATPTSAP